MRLYAVKKGDKYYSFTNNMFIFSSIFIETLTDCVSKAYNVSKEVGGSIEVFELSLSKTLFKENN